MARERLEPLVAQLTAAHPTPHQLDLRVKGVAIRLAFSAEQTRTALQEYYASFVSADPAPPDIEVHIIDTPPPELDVDFVVKQPDAGKTRVKDAYADFPDGRILKKIRTGMLFYFGPAGNLAVGDCLRHSNQVVNFINNRFVQHDLDRGALLCHAAGVSRAGAGIAIAGMSNRGKSTLALRLVEQGADFVTNDRLLIRREDRNLTMWGLPKFPRVNPGTLLHHERVRTLLSDAEIAELNQLPPQDLWRLERKHDIDVDRFFGPGRVQLLARMQALVILTWKLGAGPLKVERCDLAQRPDLLRDAFMKLPTIHQFVPPGKPHPDYTPERYLAELGACPVYVLSGGVDFDAATAACEALLPKP
jgi:HprK-related kinase B